MVKNLPDNAGDTGSIPRSGRSPGGENGDPLHYSCLDNPMDRGVWQAIAYGVAELTMTKRRSVHTICIHTTAGMLF